MTNDPVFHAVLDLYGIDPSTGGASGAAVEPLRAALRGARPAHRRRPRRSRGERHGERAVRVHGGGATAQGRTRPAVEWGRPGLKAFL